jgi:hypothetical protein
MKDKGAEMMSARQFLAIAGMLAILLPPRTFARRAEIDNFTHSCRMPQPLDDQNQQSGTAAKDDVFLDTHDDSYDGDSHLEKFSYNYKNIGSKTIKAVVTVKAQHHGFYENKTRPEPFRAEKFSFTFGPGEEHAVSGTWKIDKPSSEGDPEMEYADDDHPELLQATYSDSK